MRRALGQRPALRRAVVEAVTALMERQLAEARGVRASTARRLYRHLRHDHPDLAPRAVDALLEPWLDALQPLWDRHVAPDEATPRPGSLAALVAAHPAEAADALLRLAERHATGSRHAWVRAAARRARRLGADAVARALPDAARLMDHLTRAHHLGRGLEHAA